VGPDERKHCTTKNGRGATDGNAIEFYNQARAAQNNKGQRRTFLIY